MSTLTKEAYDKIPEQRIKIIVDFPNLSEDARDAEKKKMLYTTYIPTSTSPTKSIDLSIFPTKNSNESEKEYILNKLRQNQKNKENLPFKQAGQASVSKKPKFNIKILRSAPLSAKKQKLNLDEDSMDIDIEAPTPKILPPTTMSNFPSIAQSPVTIIKLQMSPGSMLKSNFNYSNVLSFLRNAPVKEATANSGKVITLKNNIPPNTPILMSLLDCPLHLNELKCLIPAQHLSKNKNDILVHSPIDIGGITCPRLMVLPKHTPLSRCFSSTKVSFQRYIINFGPGDITHIVIPRTSAIELPQLISLKNLRELLVKNRKEYYDFFQSKGDVVIIQANTYHYSFVKSETDVIAVNWSVLRNDSNSIEAAWNNKDNVPMMTTLVKYANKEIGKIEPSVRMLIMEELNREFKEMNDIHSKNKRIGVKQMAKNVNLCTRCYKDLFNYYAVVNSSPLCINCYMHLDIKKRIIFYKYREEDLRYLYKRLSFFTENKTNDKSELELPQSCFQAIESEPINMSEINKVMYPASEFVFIPDMTNDIDHLSRVAKGLHFLCDSNAKQRDIFDYDKVMSEDIYIDYETVFGNERRFSPDITQRKSE